MGNATKSILPTRRGIAALEAACAGAPLYVLNPQTGWERADATTLTRAKRFIAGGASHATWIYGS